MHVEKEPKSWKIYFLISWQPSQFALNKKKTGWGTRVFKSILETRSVSYVWCMFVWCTFPDMKYLFGASKISDFLTSAVSCQSWNLQKGLENLVFITLGDTPTHKIHIFEEKFLTISWRKKQFAWKHEMCSLNHFSWAKSEHLRLPKFCTRILNNYTQYDKIQNTR